MDNNVKRGHLRVITRVINEVPDGMPIDEAPVYVHEAIFEGLGRSEEGKDIADFAKALITAMLKVRR